ncbi:MAG TPA: hypothetical protein VK843_06245 [Planctomycetota bacterium]|nr:hypothetical protein [Planctomycetota bacterium]
MNPSLHRFQMILETRNQARERRGGVLTSLTFALAMIALAWFVWVLESDVDAAEFTRVETSNLRLDTGAASVDARWEAMLRERIARIAPFACDDPASQDRVLRELRALPFVRSADEAEVLWPDGLRVPIVLRMPIACVRVGREVLPIANDGMLLPGAWPSPPAFGQGYLPEIALDGVSARKLRPGEVLWNDGVADALSVASSMWAELEGEDLARLGPSIIDARRARATSVEDPGTVIYLGQSRRVLFGRAPSTQEPGELPVETKWLHLANALLCLPAGPPLEPGGPPTARPGEVDWELVEVRWDHPAMLPRGAKTDARVPVKAVKTQKPKSPPAKSDAPPAKSDAGAKTGRVH